MILKASFLMIVKKGQNTNILIREDRKVWINFGSDLWINFLKIKETKNLTKDKAKNKQYIKWINSKKFKKDYKETIDVINNSSDWDEITKKFIQDFKKDRSNKIWRQDIELDTDKNLNELEVKK
ncbi:MAG: hypothetical protein ACOC56_06600 [Atribacterota bacterium]